jgi:membrane protease YdiL (CAAX protease family)
LTDDQRVRLPSLGAARRHPVVASVIAGLVVTILVNAHFQAELGRAVLYLVVLVVSVGLVDVVLDRWPARERPVPIRGPRLEFVVLAVSFVTGLFWLYARFVRGYRPAPGPLRLLWLAVLVGGVFNGLPAIFLLARRYRPSDLGFRISGLQAAPMVIAAFAVSATLLSPTTTTWKAILDESGGSIWAVIETALLAAVPEEFFRFVWQTRGGAWLRRPATGWLVTSVAWSLLHGPKDWDETHSLPATVMGMINIIPLGLLWGYLTHRTRSILPSVVLHATNVWGLQNLA